MIRRLQLLAVCIVLGIGGQQLFSFMVQLIDEAHYARQRLEVTNQLGDIRLRLEQQLNSTFYVSRGLEMLIAGLTADGTGLDDHWSEIRLWAAQASASVPNLINIGMSDRYILRFSYPLERNSTAIGLDYRKLPGQWPAVQRAVRTRQPVVAGPLQLVQGGEGLICRIPLFADRLSGRGDKFIGLVSMVIDYKALLKSVGIAGEQKGLSIAIRGRDGLGAKGDVFFGKESLFAEESVQQAVDFLGGKWIIAAKPRLGWSHESPYSLVLNVLGYVLSAFGIVLAYFAIRGLQLRAQATRQFTRELELRVSERTSQLRRAKEQAERANRAKSEFLAVITHELRTPLNSIIGLTDLILAMELGSRQRQFLEKVATSAGLLLDLISDILSFAKLESGKEEVKPVAFSLPKLLQRINDLFAVSAAKKGLEFSVERGADVPAFVMGDEAKVVQLLVNLCGNALKFTSAGEVRVRVSMVEENASGSHETSGMRRFRFVVSDTGIGISEENRRGLFEAFHQVDSSRARKYPGTGLGLSICKNFVDLMGGCIGVDSTPGDGSCFWFEIPLGVLEQLPESVKDCSEEERRALIDSARTGLTGTTLILAEDNAFNQALAAALLEKIGVVVKVAANGLEVLELLRQGSVHGVLMDIQMPEMDGMAAAAEIRKNACYRELPIIALTANAMEEDRQQVLAAGMNRFIAKPIKAEQLYQVLYESIDRNKVFNHEVN